MDALASGAGISGLNGHTSPCRFTYLCVKEPHEAADLVVVLSHLGFPQDFRLAGEVQGIDVLLSGHTHNRMERPAWVNGTPIIQSGCHGSFVGRLDIQLREGKVTVCGHELVALDDSIPADPDVKALVDDALTPHRSMLGEVVGHTRNGLHRNTMLQASMDDLLLAAIADAAGTELAFSNGWRYGAPVPPGPITMADLWDIIPGNPPVSVVELTGAELVEMMEENLERTFAADPFEQMGGFVKRCRGLQLYAKLENPAGHRIDRLFVGGEPVQPGDSRTAAFVTAQGVPAKFGRHRRDLDVRAVDALRGWVAGRDFADPEFVPSVIAV